MKIIKFILLFVFFLSSISCDNNNSMAYTSEDIEVFKSDFEYTGSIENNDVVIKKYIGNASKIIIPNFVTTIGRDSFYGCETVESIDLPYSITYIESFAFEECDNLENIYYRGTIKTWCNIKIYSNPMTFAEHFYMLNGKNVFTEVTSIEIPTTIKTLGHGQFKGLNIDRILIPVSVVEIGYLAFETEIIYYQGTLEQWNEIIIHGSYVMSEGALTYKDILTNVKHLYVKNLNNENIDVIDKVKIN